ncbi:MAG: hypothetical protein ACRCWB_09875 [Enterovibrio sp.]
MSIGGNGANRRPASPNNAELRQRRAEANEADADVAQGQAAAAAPAHDDNRSLRARAFSGVRNTLSNPATTVCMIVGAVAASYALSWLFGASGASNGALTNAPASNFGGTPLPPQLNPSQVNSAAPQAPANSCPVPTLTEILRNAGYPQPEQTPARDYSREGARPRAARQRHNHSPRRGERAHRHRAHTAQREQAAQTGQAAAQESASVPRCPDEIVFVSPRLQTPLMPSETQRMLQRDSTEGLCEGSLPRLTLRPVTSLAPRFLCRDTHTQRPATSCTIREQAHSCEQGQDLEQCAGLRLSEWAHSTTAACVRARALEKEITVVLEGTDLLESRGVTLTAQEQAAFDNEIKHFCGDGVKIYSEDPPFKGISDWAKDRIHFGAKPEDILQGRSSNRNAEPQSARAEQEAAQEAATDNAQDGTSEPQPEEEQTSSNNADHGNAKTPEHE